MMVCGSCCGTLSDPPQPSHPSSNLDPPHPTNPSPFPNKRIPGRPGLQGFTTPPPYPTAAKTHAGPRSEGQRRLVNFTLGPRDVNSKLFQCPPPCHRRREWAAAVPLLFFYNLGFKSARLSYLPCPRRGSVEDENRLWGGGLGGYLAVSGAYQYAPPPPGCDNTHIHQPDGTWRVKRQPPRLFQERGFGNTRLD